MVHEYPNTISNNLQNISFLKELVERWSIDQIIHEMIDVLNYDRTNDIFQIYMFLRDVSIYRKQSPEFDGIVDLFRTELPKSTIFDLMNEKLYSQNKSIRSNTIFTFGKMYFSQNADYLKQAFNYYEIHHPDELEELQFEYNWLLK